MTNRRDPGSSWMPPMLGEVSAIDPRAWSERERQRKRWILLQAWRMGCSELGGAEIDSWLARAGSPLRRPH